MKKTLILTGSIIALSSLSLHAGRSHRHKYLDRIEDMVEDFEGWFSRIPGGEHLGIAQKAKMDVKKYAEKYELRVEFPGFRKEDIKIERKDGHLSISAQREEKEEKEEKKDDAVTYLRKESSSALSRTFPLPEDWDDSKEIEAHYEEGVLMVSVPLKKIEKKKKKDSETIAIK